MRKLLFTLTLCFTKFLLASNSDPYVNATFGGDPSLNVDGVNVITGDYSQQTIGIYVHGAEPIDTSLSYSTALRNNKNGGCLFTRHSQAFGSFENYGWVYVTEPSGITFLYKKETNRDHLLTKSRPNGETLIYDIESNTFGAFTIDGLPKTMFKPAKGISYWETRN